MDRKLDEHEKDLLRKSDKALDFIGIFKADIMEPGGRDAYTEPSLYEMVILQILAKLETHQKMLIDLGIEIRRLKQHSGVVSL